MRKILIGLAALGVVSTAPQAQAQEYLLHDRPTSPNRFYTDYIAVCQFEWTGYGYAIDYCWSYPRFVREYGHYRYLRRVPPGYRPWWHGQSLYLAVRERYYARRYVVYQPYVYPDYHAPSYRPYSHPHPRIYYPYPSRPHYQPYVQSRPTYKPPVKAPPRQKPPAKPPAAKETPKK